MNRNQVTMQLYTTRKFQPYEPIFKFLSESGIKNIELFDLDKIDLDNFKSKMEENSISIKSSHISFQAITLKLLNIFWHSKYVSEIFPQPTIPIFIKLMLNILKI